MLKFVSYILLAQMMYFVGAKSFVILNWKINQDAITEKYCVNKDKPMMNCDGKCYLSKQLENLELKEEQERKDFPNPENKVETVNYSWIIEDATDEKFTFVIADENNKIEYSKVLISDPHLQQFFHPPTV